MASVFHSRFMALFAALIVAMIALAMVNLELTKANVFNDPAVINNTGIPAGAKKFAIMSIVFWSLAICAGRLTEYPAFVQAWFGF